MPIQRHWQRELVAKQTPEERAADARAYREMAQRIEEAKGRRLSPYAERIERDMDAAGERHDAIKSSVAAAVAQGADTGTVPCHCGAVVTYRPANRFGIRHTSCDNPSCATRDIGVRVG